MNSKSRLTMALAVAMYGAFAFGAVGDVLTFSNASGTGDVAGFDTTKTFAVTIPARAGLPVGSSVRLDTITLGLNGSGDTVQPYLRIFKSETESVDSAAVNGTGERNTATKFANNAFRQAYAFGAAGAENECVLTVGTTYALEFLDADKNKAAVRWFCVSTTDANTSPVYSSALQFYRIAQEVTCTVTAVNDSDMYYTTVSSDGWWSGLSFTGKGSTWVSGSDVEVASAGSYTLSANQSIGTGYFVPGADGASLTLATVNGWTINNAYIGLPLAIRSGITLGNVSVMDGGSLIIDATTADNAVGADTRTAIRTTDARIYIRSGASTKATLDYGNNVGQSMNAHLVFESGTSDFAYGMGTGSLAFSTTGTLENPTVLVKDGATLNFALKDINGWNGARVDTSVIRVAKGGTLNFVPNGGSSFMSSRIVMEPGSATTIKTDNNSYGFCVYGGAATDGTKAQLYVPAPSEGATAAEKVATLTRASDSPYGINFGKSQGTGGATICVEGDATLKVSADMTGAEDVYKLGTGTLELAPNWKSSFKIPNRKLDGGFTIDNLAVYTAQVTDSLNYDSGNARLDVKGGLDLATYRWTIFAHNTFNIYADGYVAGTGDGQGALDIFHAETIHVLDSDSPSKVASIRAPLRLQQNSTFDVAEGVTLELADIISTAGKTLTKTGAGNLKLVGTGALNAAPTVSAGKLDVVANADLAKAYVNNSVLGLSPTKDIAMSGVISGTGTVVVDAAQVSIVGFLSIDASSPTTLKNMTLENLSSVSGKLGGTSVNNGNTAQATVYGFTQAGEAGARTASFWLEVYDDVYVKGVKVELAEYASGIKAWVSDSRYRHVGTGYAFSGEDISAANAGGKADFNGAAGYGAMNLVLTYGAATVTLSGANTYSGGTTVANGALVATDIAALGTGPVTVKSGATLNFTSATIPEGASYVKLSNCGAITVENGGTLLLNGAALPTGWTMVDGYAMAAQPMPVSFVTPNGPTTAQGVVVESDSSFGGADTYAQTVGGKAAQVVDVIGSAGSAYTIFGGMPYGTVGTLQKDIWLNVEGGSFKAIVGGNNCDSWSASGNNSLQGDVVVEVGGSAVVENVIGGHFKDGNKDISPLVTLDGNTTVVIKDDAVVKGLIAGAGISAHNATATYTGNAKVLVKNVQSDNSAGAWIIADSSDYIVGGGVYSTNANSKENVSGNTEVVVDVPASATGDFVKNIVGGGMMPTGGSNRENPQCRVGGNSSVTISAPAAVTFTGNIYAGGFNAGGNGDVTVAGSATLTINGGSFSSTATLNGGVATGTKALVINQDMGFGSSRIIGFDAIAVGDGKTFTVTYDSGLATVTKMGGGVLVLDGDPYTGAISLAAGSVKSATAITVTSTDRNKKVVADTESEPGYTIYTLDVRDATTVYLREGGTYVLSDGTATTLRSGDVVMVDSNYGNQWNVILPSGISGHSVVLSIEMNLKDGIPENTELEAQHNVYLYGNISTGVSVSGTGTLRVGYSGNVCQINGAVSILSGLAFNDTSSVVKLNSGATLTVASELAAGKVVTDEAGQVVVYDATTRTYSLTPYVPPTVTLTPAAPVFLDYTNATIVATVSAEGTFDAAAATYTATVGNQSYNGTYANGSVTFEIPGSAGASANVTITATPEGGSAAVATTATSFVFGSAADWFEETATKFETTGDWENAEPLEGKIVLSGDANATFTPTMTMTGNTADVVWVVSFDAPNDDDLSEELVGAQTAFRLATGGFQLWVTNGSSGAWVDVAATGITPAINTEYTVTNHFDYSAHTLTVTVNGQPLTAETGGATTFALPSGKTKVDSFEFAGAGALTGIAGNFINTMLYVDGDGTAYATLAEALASGKPVTALDPDVILTVEPGLELTVPTGMPAANIKPTYNGASISGYVNVSIENGKVTLSATDAATPSATAMTADGIAVGNVKPGLYYWVEASTTQNFDEKTVTVGTPVQATSEAAVTVVPTNPTTGKVIFYRVAVDAEMPATP